jgi:hypothetical protein
MYVYAYLQHKRNYFNLICNNNPFFPYKGIVSRDFHFHESVSPKPLSIPLGLFRIFLKIRGDIHSARCTIGVIDTGSKWKKSSVIKSFHFFVWTPLVSRVNL